MPTPHPVERGYHRGAWMLSEYHHGLGYDRDAAPRTSLGTPGYANTMSDDETDNGHISISEVMYATHERGTPAQWIELYNSSATEVVDLEGWTLRIEVRDHTNPCNCIS